MHDDRSRCAAQARLLTLSSLSPSPPFPSPLLSLPRQQTLARTAAASLALRHSPVRTDTALSTSQARPSRRLRTCPLPPTLLTNLTLPASTMAPKRKSQDMTAEERLEFQRERNRNKQAALRARRAARLKELEEENAKLAAGVVGEGSNAPATGRQSLEGAVDRLSGRLRQLGVSEGEIQALIAGSEGGQGSSTPAQAAQPGDESTARAPQAAPPDSGWSFSLIPYELGLWLTGRLALSLIIGVLKHRPPVVESPPTQHFQSPQHRQPALARSGSRIKLFELGAVALFCLYCRGPPDAGRDSLPVLFRAYPLEPSSQRSPIRR